MQDTVVHCTKAHNSASAPSLQQRPPPTYRRARLFLLNRKVPNSTSACVVGKIYVRVIVLSFADRTVRLI